MAERFRAEASCPICLGLFEDPVSIHCGHHFCRGCIARRWAGLDGAFPCPRCRETAPRRSPRPSRELAKVVEVARRWSLRGSGLCPEHREAPKLFCERERVPICLRCREAPLHRQHPVVPIEEAAEEYKEKLQAHIQVLKDKKEKLLALKASEEGKSLDLLERVEAEKRKVAAGMEELHRLVEDQERLLLGRLEGLALDIGKRREEKAERLSRDVASIGEDIAELQGRCQQPAWEFLQDIGSILSRLEEEEEEEGPKADGISPELGEEPGGCPEPNAALEEILRKCQAHVRLDPATAHPSLALSPDGRSARWDGARRALPDLPARFDASRCVLARGAFTGGRHYWEVTVAAGDAWAVGVAKESVPRKGRLSLNPDAGVWALGRCGSRCQALARPAAPIELRAVPEAVGVYVDYEAGRVAFFDATRRAPIFAYPVAAFAGERLLPLLCLGRGCHLTLAP
ncbi:E3 ubiquitin-protein ligase TRIM39-like [Eudromia elegans]